MMNLILKTLWDKRFFILGWSFALLLLGYSIAVIYPTFNENMIDGLAGSVPPELQGFIGQLSDLKQIDTYLASQLFQSNLPIIICIFALLLAVSITVGEEDNGQLRTLVALPVSRRKVVLAKWCAIAVIALVAVLANALGAYAGVLQIGEHLNSESLLLLSLMTWLLTVAIATLVFGIGLISGSRALTITLGVLIVALSYLVTTFAMGVEWLDRVSWLSILHYFPAVDIARGTFEPNNVVVYSAIILIMLSAALVVFSRRDIKS